MKTFRGSLVTALAVFAHGALACDTVLVPNYDLPKVAPGWQIQLIANGFKKPRSIQFDSEGGLLVVDSGVGIRRLKLWDNGDTCLSVQENKLLIDKTDLNHGLALSGDSKTLYVSNVQSVFSYGYDARGGSITGSSKIVIDGMSNNDHTTRTLLMSKKRDGLLVVSRGSDENFDVDALDVNTGLSQIKVFDLTQSNASKAYDFNSQGRRLGWGLRNSVGVAEEPVTGEIYSVENSIDDITRNGQDIHQNNPGEELNFHGKVTDTNQGGNYGYPRCFALWDPNIPDASSLRIGNQFSITQNSTLSDTICADEYVAPRVTFHPHTAPLDIKFESDGSSAYIAFHGSFNRDEPAGYTVSSLAFSNGQPSSLADSQTAVVDIMSNPDVKKCPSRCFRPAGLAFDSKGRLWMSSDTTGEIFVIQKKSDSPGTFINQTSKPGAGSSVWNTQTEMLLVAFGAAAMAAMIAF